MATEIKTVPGAGILDSLTKVGKRPKVNVSASFLPGMKVSIWRPKHRPEPWIHLCDRIIKEIPKDARGWPTNEIIFVESLPPEVKTNDLLIYEVSDGN